MKRPRTKFQAHTMTDSKVIRLKKSKFSIRSTFIVGSKFVAAQFFILINILLKLQQQMLTCLGVVVLDVKLYRCRTFSVTTGDLLTLNISLERLEWFSSTVFYLWFRWVFRTFDFCFIATATRCLAYRFDFLYMLCILCFQCKRGKLTKFVNY